MRQQERHEGGRAWAALNEICRWSQINFVPYVPGGTPAVRRGGAHIHDAAAALSAAAAAAGAATPTIRSTAPQQQQQRPAWHAAWHAALQLPGLLACSAGPARTTLPPRCVRCRRAAAAAVLLQLFLYHVRLPAAPAPPTCAQPTRWPLQKRTSI